MATVTKEIDQADALVESLDAEKVSADLASMVATYQRHREKGTLRAQHAHARAVVRRAAREGFKIPKASAAKKSAAPRGAGGGRSGGSAGGKS